VLITSCHVLLNPNIGPVTTHATTISEASPKHSGRPVNRAANFASRVKALVFLIVIPTPR
jgi:hypothetical protein